jgi:Holliday junction resolvase-like predicted endonuclease
MLLFVEVKARTNNMFQDCVSTKQVSRSISAAKFFLDLHPHLEELEIRYDLILVGSDNNILEIIENAITEDM